VNTAGIPLKAYEDSAGLQTVYPGCRAAWLHDRAASATRCWTATTCLPSSKGALTEQYVCQQLETIEDLGIYYYTNERGSCEVDFVLDAGSRIIPLEAKAETNLKAKSLRMFKERFAPEISVRTSMAAYKREDWLINLPLYAVEEIQWKK
jgi:predicted AAA+ superfamily ATPase